MEPQIRRTELFANPDLRLNNLAKKEMSAEDIVVRIATSIFDPRPDCWASSFHPLARLSKIERPAFTSFLLVIALAESDGQPASQVSRVLPAHRCRTRDIVQPGTYLPLYQRIHDAKGFSKSYLWHF